MIGYYLNIYILWLVFILILKKSIKDTLIMKTIVLVFSLLLEYYFGFRHGSILTVSAILLSFPPRHFNILLLSNCAFLYLNNIFNLYLFITLILKLYFLRYIDNDKNTRQ